MCPSTWDGLSGVRDCPSFHHAHGAPPLPSTVANVNPHETPVELLVRSKSPFKTGDDQKYITNYNRGSSGTNAKKEFPCISTLPKCLSPYPEEFLPLSPKSQRQLEHNKYPQRCII